MRRDEFIAKAVLVHGNKYGYGGVPDTMLENDTPVPIVCPIHGLFYQTVYQHLNGVGCIKCLEK